MSYIKEFRLPNLGDGDGGGRIVEWFIETGELFHEGQLLVEVETDKAAAEVPATEAGRVTEILAPPDARVARGEVVARFEVEGSPPAGDPVVATVPNSQPALPPDPGETGVPGSTAPSGLADAFPAQPELAGRVVATPAARRRAAETGVSLHALSGTGRRGRINLSDVERALAAGRPGPLPLGSAVPLREDEFSVVTRRGEIAIRHCRPESESAEVKIAFLHGLFAESGVWSATARFLARRGVETFALDLPNHGRSGCAVTAFPDVVAAISEALEHTVSRPMVLCGHSYGGAVAARVAGVARCELQALLLIAPLGFGTEANRSFLQGMLHAETLEALSREVGRLAVSKNAIPGREYLQSLLQHIQDHRENLNAMCHGVVRHGVQQIDMRHDCAELPAPSRVIWGRRDEVLPWKHALSVPETAGLHLIPESGHMPMWDAGALVTRVLLELAQQSLGRTAD